VRGNNIRSFAPRRRGRPSRRRARSRLVLLAAAAILLIAILVAALRPSGPPPPLPGIGLPARSGDPFAYLPAHQADFVARATAGSAHVLFAKSPGGVLATAARVASLRGLIDAAATGTGIDPGVLEGLVFVESAGRPGVIAGADPANAAGLTQILAETGQSMLGMHVDLARSRQLTAAIDRANALGQVGVVARLQRQRALIDDRFAPRKALAAAVRYLQMARQRFGRTDLAVVSYHMGIGNLGQVLADYDGGRSVPYPQLYFDTAPDNHASAYALLSGFGDDSSLYYWRVLGAEQIMHLYRVNRSALGRLSSLQAATDSPAEVLHPPDLTPAFADPNALYRGYATRAILPLPSNASSLGLAYDPAMGSLAHQAGATPALYRGLRAPALDLLIELAARVRTLSHGAAPLIVGAAVTDARYEQLLGVSDPPAAAGYSFTLTRRYVNRGQAVELQAMLDRLQALNVIAWVRYPATIEVTVASDASRVIVNGP
jgi:Transglycosylase SLT domain